MNKEEQDADKHPGRLIERLQDVQLRQRSIIQRFQAENARLLDDLVDVRQERDAFRVEAARVRRENVELLNKLNEVLTEYRDLKRERATVVRFVTTATHARGRGAAEPSCKESLLLLEEEPPVNRALQIESNRSYVPHSNQGQTKLPPIAEIQTTGTKMQTTAAKEKAARPKLQPYVHRALPDPLKSELPQPDNSVSTPVTARSDSRGVPVMQAGLRRDHGASVRF